jgi:hypothetical protein
MKAKPLGCKKYGNSTYATLFMKTSHIVYAINVEDVQNVAEEEYGRTLDDRELKLVEENIGDYIDWFSSVAACIAETVKKD